MASAHESVIYVEPNMEPIKDGWAVEDRFERAPRLEDYCIAMNIEVEVYSRTKVDTLSHSLSDVLILQCIKHTGEDGKADEFVNFMGGTKIGGYDYGKDGISRTPRLGNTYDALTTYYADMYVGDLIHYGTSEMVGIKSMNIEYKMNCVPVINVVFTDVRGLSIFQPQELASTNSYNGLKGIDKNNVAQSFFQCFFKMPLPKFTIYIKGFYGEPVAYEVMCDKFETSFNSQTGDFEFNTSFIGYSYSFLTDVSMSALMAAPYSDYKGKEYWDNKVKNGEFFVYGKDGNTTQEMPTLTDLVKRYLGASLSGTPEDEETTLEYEEDQHEMEIKELRALRDTYNNWYEKLYEKLSLVKNPDGSQRCFDFKDGGTNPDYRMILILADKYDDYTLERFYKESLSIDFKDVNEKTYNEIKTYNEKENKVNGLDNVSLDFSDYKKFKFIDKVVYNENGTKTLFIPNKVKHKTEIEDRLFNYKETIEESGKTVEYDIGQKTIDTIIKWDLKYAYIIEVNYSQIAARVNSLVAQMNRNKAEIDEENRARILNDKIMRRMKFYPSIENFTRIMMAHLETFMHIMYSNADEIIEQKRTLEMLGVSGENTPDKNDSEDYIPPYPRVTERVYGEDNIARDEDTWIGKFKSGIGFREMDVIDGLFNGIEHVYDLLDYARLVNENNEVAKETEEQPLRVPHPMMPYDFFITGTPFGAGSSVLNDVDEFIGRVAIRMYEIFGTSMFRVSGNIANISSKDVTTCAKVEAINFRKSTVLRNTKILEVIGKKSDTSSLTWEKIENVLFNGGSFYEGGTAPWNTNSKREFFTIGEKSGVKFNLYKHTVGSGDKKSNRVLYPVQGESFASLENDFVPFSQDRGFGSINSFAVGPNKFNNGDEFLKAVKEWDNDNGFNSVYFVENYKHITEAMDNTLPMDYNAESNYEAIQKSILRKAAIPDMNIFLNNGVIRRKIGVVSDGKTQFEYKYYDTGNTIVYYTTDANGIKQICAENTEGAETATTAPVTDYYDTATSEGENNFNKYIISELRCVDVANGVLIKDKDFGTNWEGISNQGPEGKLYGCALGLEAIDAIDYGVLRKYMVNDENVFMYLPRLAILQIGAVIYMDCPNMCEDKYAGTNLEKVIPISDSARVKLSDNKSRMANIIHNMSPYVRLAYAKYFYNWAKSDSGTKFYNILMRIAAREPGIVSIVYKNGNSFRRIFINEGSVTVNPLTAELMSLILVVKGSMSYNPSIPANNKKFETSWVKEYFSAFLDELRVLYGFKEEDTIDESGVLHMAKPPAKTTDEMKMELYRYLKLIYDKWIPSNPEVTWGLETFFDTDKEASIVRELGGGGHLFHFIDSYYNKVGKKLLVNVGKLSNRVFQLLETRDVNVMMLGFMADIYSDNRCMMLCIQNFNDLSDEYSMNRIFKPIPYNEMRMPNKHPDFVVVYPYEPSKNLDINNGEFKDDGFMLNDEEYTPIAIKSRDTSNGKCYKIPAIGVSYGKQYQNYFKSINVNMSSPIATQQSIIAKHAILMNSKGDKSKGTQGQDMFDIYSTQSYTCTVEMMGCAWIQPMMYFVLTNVPMFKGSYMIMNVKHSITQGDMTTTFTGCRMAKTTNKLVENIFTDDFDAETPDMSIDTKRERYANTNNNCPYKVYNLFESDDMDVNTTETEKELYPKAMSLLIGYGFTKEAAAGMCGNIYKESSWKVHVTNRIGAYGLCQWLGDRKKLLFTKYGNNPSFEQQIEYINYEWNHESGARGHKSDLMAASSPENAAYIVRKFFERPGEAEADDTTRQQRARYYFDNYNTASAKSSKKVTPDKATKNDLYTEFMRCLRLTVNSTDFGKVRLLGKITGEYLMITQGDNKTDKLPLVFDIILQNYYEYVQELWWVYPKNELKNNPVRISVILSMKPDITNRKVLFVDDGNKDASREQRFSASNAIDTINRQFLLSITKKFKRTYTDTVEQSGANGKQINELPQFDKLSSILTDSRLSVSDCNDTVNEEVNQTPGEISPGDAGKIDGWDVGKACAYIISHEVGCKRVNGKTKCGHSLCAPHVEDAIAAGGGPLKNRMYCGDRPVSGGPATNLRYGGILKKNGFVQIDSGIVSAYGNADIKLQAGDVAILGPKSGGKFHACMFTSSRGWVSDFIQKNMNVYGTSQPYAIYRFHNKKKS